jgi:hypothetical protein
MLWDDAPPLTVEITDDDFSKFNLTSFELKPGRK